MRNPADTQRTPDDMWAKNTLYRLFTRMLVGTGTPLPAAHVVQPLGTKNSLTSRCLVSSKFLGNNGRQ